MMENKKSLVTINLIIFTVNLLFVVIATYFVGKYWNEKGIFVAKAISMWLALGALARHHWYVTILLLVIFVFFIKRLLSDQSLEIIGARLTLWLLVIWSGVLYVPLIYVQFFILRD